MQDSGGGYRSTCCQHGDSVTHFCFVLCLFEVEDEAGWGGISTYPQKIAAGHPVKGMKLLATNNKGK